MNMFSPSVVIARFENGNFITRRDAGKRADAHLDSSEEYGWAGFALHKSNGTPLVAIDFLLDEHTRSPIADTLPGIIVQLGVVILDRRSEMWRQLLWLVRALELDSAIDMNFGRPLGVQESNTFGTRPNPFESIRAPLEYPREDLLINDDVPPLDPLYASDEDAVLLHAKEVLPTFDHMLSKRDGRGMPVTVKSSLYHGKTGKKLSFSFNVYSEGSQSRWSLTFTPPDGPHGWSRKSYSETYVPTLQAGLRKILNERVGIVEEGTVDISNREWFEPGEFAFPPETIELFELLDEPNPLLWEWERFFVWAQEMGFEVLP